MWPPHLVNKALKIDVAMIAMKPPTIIPVRNPFIHFSMVYLTIESCSLSCQHDGFLDFRLNEGNIQDGHGLLVRHHGVIVTKGNIKESCQFRET
jgi:hypothetical protein